MMRRVQLNRAIQTKWTTTKKSSLNKKWTRKSMNKSFTRLRTFNMMMHMIIKMKTPNLRKTSKIIIISETTPSWKRIERRNKILRDLMPKRGDKYKISLIRIARKKCVSLRKFSKWSTIIARKTWKSVTTCSISTLRTFLIQIALLVLS